MKRPSPRLDRELLHVADLAGAAAADNASVTVREQGGGDAGRFHPEWRSYYALTLEGIVSSLQHPRRFTDYVPHGRTRPLTEKQAERVEAYLLDMYGIEPPRRTR